MKTLKTRRVTILVIFLAVAVALAAYFLRVGDAGYSYRVPVDTGDGWTTASLDNVGLDKSRLTDLMNGLADLEDNPLHSIVIVKDGKLAFEEYFSGEDISATEGLQFVNKDFDRDTLHSLASASKSVTSVLLGIAIDKGKIIRGIDETLYSYFPEYSDLDDPTKDTITLRHLLTMSSGIPWDESYPYDDPRNDLGYMVLYTDDPIGYVLAKPLVADPGEVFIYNSGTTNLLGEIIRRSTGMTLADLAAEYLFAPLGITSWEWVSFPADPDMAVASSLLYLKPRDMAKIGQLYMQKGVWNGERIVSESWVAESTARQIGVPTGQIVIPDFNTSYGYQWWRGTFATGETDTYYAAGWGGQFIFVLPEVDMVVVFTAGNYQGGYEGFIEMVNDYILPAAGVS